MTPLGATGQGERTVARRVVSYLEGDDPSPTRRVLNPDPGGLGVVRYFSDSMEGPGVWLGRAATAEGLVGTVNRQVLEWVLAGRHPGTGERLISARGSSGRSHLQAGTAARLDVDGGLLYSVSDVAALAGMSHTTVDELIAQADSGARCDGLANWLRAEATVDGERFVRDVELNRWLELIERGVPGDAVRSSGSPDEVLSGPQAAALVGVSPQYIRRLCQRYWKHPLRFENGTARGEWIRCELAPGRGSGRYHITRADLAEWADRRKPAAVRCGFDLTLTTEKSFALAMMLSPPDVGQHLGEIFDEANRLAVTYLEAHAAAVRTRGRREPADGLIVASYLHATSRALDPFPHRHNVVANTAVSPSGERKALDARPLYEHAPTAAALATAHMRWRLSTERGVRWTRSSRGVWEIDGVPETAIAEFSTRRGRIELASAELENILRRPLSKSEVQQLVLETRDPKEPTSVQDLLKGWQARAAVCGLDPHSLHRCFGHRPAVGADEHQLAELFARLQGPNGMTAETNVFTRSDVLTTLVNATVTDANGAERLLVLPAESFEHLADRFLCEPGVVPLDPTVAGPNGQQLYTTLELLECQDRIRTRFTQPETGTHAVVPAGIIEHTLEDNPWLDRDQQSMIHRLCGSGLRYQLAVGLPGTGKTAAMRVTADTWKRAGYRVLGAAVKGEAARLLGDAAGIETNTLAWFLAHDDPQRHPLDANTVLIVDEASTIADRDLDRLLTIIDTTGATLRLVGDPAQHGSVGAGGSFRALCELHADSTPRLEVGKRLQDPTEQTVADAVRDGHIHRALQLMQQSATLIEANDEHHGHLATLQRWWQARLTGHDHPMVDRHNTTRRALNDIAHRLLVAAGHVAPTGLRARDGREFTVGDRVIAKQPRRDLHVTDQPDRYVRNGSVGTITNTSPERQVMTVDFDGVGAIEIPATFLNDDSNEDCGKAGRGGPSGRPGLEHAYAVTSYAVQGATFPRSTSIITPASSQAELYVDITRGRTDNTIITIHLPVERDDEPHLPRLPPPPLTETVATSLAAKPGERCAIDLDPAALERHRSEDAAQTAKREEDPIHLSERVAQVGAEPLQPRNSSASVLSL